MYRMRRVLPLYRRGITRLGTGCVYRRTTGQSIISLGSEYQDMQELDTEELKEQLIGVAPRQSDGEVPCMTHPEVVDDEYLGDRCSGSIGESDEILVWFVNEDDLYDQDKGWYIKYEFCPGCCSYEELPEKARKKDVDQVLSRARLQRTGSHMGGEFREDALTLVDVDILDRSDKSDGI